MPIKTMANINALVDALSWSKVEILVASQISKGSPGVALLAHIHCSPKINACENYQIFLIHDDLQVRSSCVTIIKVHACA